MDRQVYDTKRNIERNGAYVSVLNVLNIAALVVIYSSTAALSSHNHAPALKHCASVIHVFLVTYVYMAIGNDLSHSSGSSVPAGKMLVVAVVSVAFSGIELMWCVFAIIHASTCSTDAFCSTNFPLFSMYGFSCLYLTISYAVVAGFSWSIYNNIKGSVAVNDESDEEAYGSSLTMSKKSKHRNNSRDSPLCSHAKKRPTGSSYRNSDDESDDEDD
jgi:hypothetical protein